MTSCFYWVNIMGKWFTNIKSKLRECKSGGTVISVCVFSPELHNSNCELKYTTHEQVLFRPPNKGSEIHLRYKELLQADPDWSKWFWYLLIVKYFKASSLFTKPSISN